jgi:hypothetical protein
MFTDELFLINTFNAIPFPTLVVDDDVRILFRNSVAAGLLGSGDVYQKRGGEALHCIHSTETRNGCGHAPYCKNCIVRLSVGEAIGGGKVYRKKTIMNLKQEDIVAEVPLLVTSSPYTHKDKRLALLILEDIHELMQLGSLLPICAKCKKIQSDNKEWETVEKYIKTHIVDVDFTHGLCTDCMREVQVTHRKYSH